MTRNLATIFFLLVLAGPILAEDLRPPNRDGQKLRRSRIVDVYESCRDSVVTLASYKPKEDASLYEFFEFNPKTNERTLGSGFIIHRDGYIMTNAHVVERTPTRQVTLSNGKTYIARVIGVFRSKDLALVKIDGAGPLKPVILALPNDEMVGETIIAIGNPHGFQYTCTVGIVSAVNRSTKTEFADDLTNMIQTDAPINPGSSGGPLFNLLGEVVGVVTSNKRDGQSIAFAGSIDTVRKLLPDMLNVERRYGILSGVEVAESTGRDAGCRVTATAPAADSNGVRAGDVIEKANGRVIDSVADWSLALVGSQPGKALPLVVSRGGKQIDLKLIPARRPAPDTKSIEKLMGVKVKELNAARAKKMKLRVSRGLEVASVNADHFKGQSPPKVGDVIVRIGDRRPVDAQHAAFLLAELQRTGQKRTAVFVRSADGGLTRINVKYADK